MGISNIIIGVVNLNVENSLGNFTMGNIFIGCSLLLIAVLFLRLGSPIRKKIKRLNQEKVIRE